MKSPIHSTFTQVIDFMFRSLIHQDHIGMLEQPQKITDKETFRQMIRKIHEKTAEKGAFYDVLGEVFMESIPKSSNQVFTPPHIAELMATITEVNAGDKTITDWACGSGRLLLAGAEKNPNAYLIGCDLDILCAKMTAVNLAINSLIGEVIWGNAQTKEVFAVFKIKKAAMNFPYIEIHKETDRI